MTVNETYYKLFEESDRQRKKEKKMRDEQEYIEMEEDDATIG